jgi:Uncharacterized protein conserved in bacteria (DUF2155)
LTSSFLSTGFPLALIPMLLISACKGNEQAPVALKPSVAHKPAVEKTVVVPPETYKTWKAVRISVIDKTRATENIYTVPVGGVLHVPSTKLTILAETFLPSFIMEGSVMTSSSNSLNNPGVKVSITDNGVTVFKGWLFSKYPTTHAVANPKYGFTLVGVVPAGPGRK